jgi:ferrous iron transport protein B
MSADTPAPATGPANAVVEPAPLPGRFALVGNPNTGKSTVFTRVCGIRTKTANFPGSTVEAHIGTRVLGDRTIQIVDLPGHYGLNLDRPESRLCRDYLAGQVPQTPRPDAVIVVADATNLPRNLIFASQALQQGLPAIVVLNMIDVAQRRGLTIDDEALSRQLGCPVVRLCARTGEGIDRLLETMDRPAISTVTLPDPTDAEAAGQWADEVFAGSVGGDEAVGSAADTVTDRLDAAFTHPVLGIVVFVVVMAGLFYTIFTLATVPMDLIELLFAHLGALAGAVIPPGAIHDLVVDGVVAGVAGTVVFLPQICLLFLLISLLEDTGYLARAAFVMDRLMRRFGLPGQSFVPLLSAHACAIPAIMSARLVPDHRDRLATILVAPFMSCSARLPVYVLLIGVLFGDRPLLAGLAFSGCYVLGAAVAMLSALVARRTFLAGRSRPMVLELPAYSVPSLRTALLITFDRAVVFLRNAGTVIVGICIVLWWLGAYPRVDPPPEALAMRTEAREVIAADADEAARLETEADALEARHARSRSFMGRIGHFVEPVFAPLGYDWQLTVGVMSSLLAREVFVSTMAVVVAGTEEVEDQTVRQRIVGASRADGRPVFSRATAASLLVYYVLAMQCLPTLAVTRRETGGWRWAALQLGYMTGLAYVLAWIVYRAAIWMGAG